MKRIAGVVLGAGIGAAVLSGTALAATGNGVWSSPETSAADRTVTVTARCEGSATNADIGGDAFVYGAKGVKVDVNGYAAVPLMVREDLGAGEYPLRATCLDKEGTTEKTGTITIVDAAPIGSAATGFGRGDGGVLAPLGAAALVGGAVLAAVALRRTGGTGS